MPSPFPGMDPYLEEHWRDVHASLVIYTRDALQGVLPSPLRARVEERVILETHEGIGDRVFFPDLRVVHYPGRREPRPRSESGSATAEPLLVESPDQPLTERFIEVIDRGSGNEVVTVVEFLSPSNKVFGPNRDQYLKKQRELRESQSNLVEIDLNRTGPHVLAVRLDHIPRESRTPYMACVRRASRRGKSEVYPMPLWERLPTIKVPLRVTDADVPLDLQRLIEQCYQNGAYEGTLNYAVDPVPPLLGADAEWAETWLCDRGLRTSRTKKGRRSGRRKPS